jgi:hypothetical protein
MSILREHKIAAILLVLFVLLVVLPAVSLMFLTPGNSTPPTIPPR